VEDKKAKGGKVGKMFPIESKKSNSGKQKLTGGKKGK
jgi:hypothetical protein